MTKKGGNDDKSFPFEKFPFINKGVDAKRTVVFKEGRVRAEFVRTNALQRRTAGPRNLPNIFNDEIAARGPK
jgi:hypothetical protein